MIIDVEFPVTGKLAVIANDDMSGFGIKSVKTISAKVTVCKLEAISAPHELVFNYQEEFNPLSTFAEIEQRAVEYVKKAIGELINPG